MNEMILIGSIAVYPDRIKAIANDIYVGGRPDAPKEKSVTIEYNDGTKYQAHDIDIKEAIEILNKYNHQRQNEISKSNRQFIQDLKEIEIRMRNGYSSKAN